MSYVNSDGVRRGTWGLGTDEGEVLGYNGNEPKPKKTLFQRMFTRSKYNTSGLNALVKKGRANRSKNNGKVPLFKFQADKYFTTNGFVDPNTGDTLKTRVSTFEQNFIKRLYGVYTNAILGRASLDLNSYAQELAKEEDETKAMLLYNELIVLYIVLCIDCIHKILQYSTKESMFYGNIRVMRKIEESIPEVYDSDKKIRLFITAIGGLLLSGLYIGALLNPVTVAASAFASVLVGVFTTGIPLFTGIILSETFAKVILPVRVWRNIGYRNPEGSFKLSLDALFISMNNIMFSPDNKIQITQVKDKLKYWGLLQRQVDYMFLNGQALASGQILEGRESGAEFVKKYLTDIIQLCVYTNTNKDFIVAPNEPFSEKLLKAAYPKSPLAGNPFANASTLKRNNLRGGRKLRKTLRKVDKSLY